MTRYKKVILWGLFAGLSFLLMGCPAVQTVIDNLNTGVIKGKVWYDQNADASEDGSETDLSNWLVYIDQNANNRLDSGERSTRTTTDGSYRFSNLPLGTHRVTQELPLGWSNTFPASNVTRSLITPRIINGVDADPNETPWLLMLITDEICGSSLIAAQWVVTAAHCVVEGDGSTVSTGTVKIILGEPSFAEGIKVANGTKAGTALAAENVYVHPNYQQLADGTVYNDIALIKLAQPLSRSRITLDPSGGSLVEDSTAVTVRGWGALEDKGAATSIDDTAAQLQATDLVTVTNSTCDTTLRDYTGKSSTIITDDMLCAGVANAAGGTDACVGDSGGPLYLNQDSTPYLVGVVSWGVSPCAASGTYGVYARVSQFSSDNGWVMNTINANGGLEQSQSYIINLALAETEQNVNFGNFK